MHKTTHSFETIHNWFIQKPELQRKPEAFWLSCCCPVNQAVLFLHVSPCNVFCEIACIQTLNPAVVWTHCQLVGDQERIKHDPQSAVSSLPFGHPEVDLLHSCSGLWSFHPHNSRDFATRLKHVAKRPQEQGIFLPWFQRKNNTVVPEKEQCSRVFQWNGQQFKKILCENAKENSFMWLARILRSMSNPIHTEIVPTGKHSTAGLMQPNQVEFIGYLVPRERPGPSTFHTYRGLSRKRNVFSRASKGRPVLVLTP